MKTCVICKKQKQLTEYNKSRIRKDGLQTCCRSCGKSMSKKYYSLNRDYQKKRCYKRRKEQVEFNQGFVYEYLSHHPCVDCQISEVIVLEFDHVRGKKSGNICYMILQGYSTDTIQREIDKCDVVCRNCHIRRTHTRNKSYKFRSGIK
jgi:hypothetical protein